MEFFRAIVEHIDILVQLRIDFLKEEMEISEKQENGIRRQFDKYLQEHLSKEDFIAVIIKQGADIASSAFLVIHEMPASPSFISGLKGTLLNVYTYPQFRRKGYAEKAVVQLIEEAKVKGISTIDLAATKDGLPLYRKLGFRESSYTSMRLKL